MACGVCGATIGKVPGKRSGYYGCHRHRHPRLCLPPGREDGGEGVLRVAGGRQAQGRQSKAIDEALAECEKKVEQLGTDLEFLRKCHTRLFKASPKEWIEERVSRIKEVLELKTERSAPLLRKLSGKIVAELMETEDGFNYLKAMTKFQCLALQVGDDLHHYRRERGG